MTICLLKEGDAYQVHCTKAKPGSAGCCALKAQVMMKAHKEGVAVVGTYSFETAEAATSEG